MINDEEIEQYVLGLFISSWKGASHLSNKVEPKYFSNRNHRRIWKAIHTIDNSGEDVDIFSVKTQLSKDGVLKSIGGSIYLANLTSSAFAVHKLEGWIFELKMKWAATRLDQICTKGRSELSDNKDPIDVLSKMEEEFKEITSIGETKFTTIAEVSQDQIDKIRETEQKRREAEKLGEVFASGLSSGIKPFDDKTGGFHNPDLIIIGGRPAMGKSAFAATIAKNVSLSLNKNNEPHNVAIFSLEMSSEQYTQRIMSMGSGVSSRDMRDGRVNNTESWSNILASVDELQKTRIFIDDTPAINVRDLRNKCRVLNKEEGLDMIIIDYLQLMTGDSGGNREQEVSGISRSLKELAKELDIPVIALSQLSRAVENRPDKKPRLSDLRESGCLVGSTLIQHPRGISEIRELDGDRKFSIFAHNKDTHIMGAKKCWKTGIKNVKKMILKTGHEILATSNHKFLTDTGWVPLGEISENDMVAIPMNYNGYYNDYSTEISYLMGAMIANGKMHKRQAITYTCNPDDIELAETIKKISESEFECTATVKDNRPKYNWINTYIKSKQRVSRNHRNPFVVFMEDQGIYDLRAKNKHLPKSIFTQNKDNIVNLLAGLYDNDGSIHLINYSNNKKSGSISYSTSSKQLADEIRLLLQMVGIVSRTKKLSRDKHCWYNISITGKKNILNFCKSIPIRSKRKQLEIIKIQERYNSIKAGWAKHYFNDNESLAFVEVKSVKDVDGEFDVYDIEVPEAHNFIANGILAHNSIEQDADIVIFLYRPEYYGIDIDDDGKSTRGIAWVLIEKQRNGPTGRIICGFNENTTEFTSFPYDPYMERNSII